MTRPGGSRGSGAVDRGIALRLRIDRHNGCMHFRVKMTPTYTIAKRTNY